MDARRIRRIATFGIVSLSLCAGLVLAQTPQAPAPRVLELRGCRIKFIDEAELSCERSGILAEIVPPGTHLEAGAEVARLRDAVLRARMAIAEKDATNDIECRFAQKAAQLALLKYQRAQVANRALAGTVSEMELRELQLGAEKAMLQAEQAEHRLVVAQLQRDEMEVTLNSVRINAPFRGLIRSVFKQPGEVVREGEVVAEIVNMDRVRVDGFVRLPQAGLVHVGQKVRLALEPNGVPLPAPSHAIEGVVSFVDVKIEPVSQRVRVSVEAPNRQGLLRDGLTATLTVAVGTADSIHR